MAKRIAGIALAVCAACGGGGSPTFATGSASVTGTIGGQSMTPRDAISTVLNLGGGNTVGSIVISTADNACAKINAHQVAKNVQVVSIGLGIQSATSVVAPAGPGVFKVYSPNDLATATGAAAAVLFVSSDALCHLSNRFDVVTAGNVTLTRVDTSGYAGTFDLTFVGGSQVTGSFTTATCAPLGTTTGVPTCV